MDVVRHFLLLEVTVHHLPGLVLVEGDPFLEADRGARGVQKGFTAHDASNYHAA